MLHISKRVDKVTAETEAKSMCFGFATGLHLFHFWGIWDQPRTVHNEGDGEHQIVSTRTGPVLSQRRECRRCGAVAYRRVRIN
jgi:hypothetical protein